jgi:hypothetical protein
MASGEVESGCEARRFCRAKECGRAQSRSETNKEAPPQEVKTLGLVFKRRAEVGARSSTSPVAMVGMRRKLIFQMALNLTGWDR